MKKKCALFLFAMLVAGITFAENHHFGVDFAGSFGFGASRFREDGGSKYISAHFVPELRVSGYEGIWFDHQLGIFALFGVGGNVCFNQKIDGKVLKKPTGGKAVDGGLALDFAVGPCYGIDLGRVRFNIGAGFHLNISKLKQDTNMLGYKTEIEQSLIWTGLIIAPQFKLSANKRCTLVVGSDFIFDFGSGGNTKTKITYRGSISESEDKVKMKESFRFIWAPYIGVGINFGS